MTNRAFNTSTLILYASTHGQTERIAREIASRFPASCLTKVVSVDKADGLDLSGFNAVVIAASIHAGHHQRPMVDWVKEHRDWIDDRSNAFISVSLTAADETDEAKETTARMISDFKSETNWWPDQSNAVAGALQYQEYDRFTRVFMRLLMKHQDHPTDSSRDFDYTDWDSVRLLGDDLVDRFIAEALDRSPSPQPM